MAESFRLYNTLRRRVEPFEPLEPGKVRLYVCGMTVYDRPHVGHARAMVTFDMVVRYLRLRGWDVTFVRNFTDVDDKIISRAQEAGEDPLALAARFIEAFQEDCAGLGLVAPDREPRVTRSIDEIIAMIQTLVDDGHAYPTNGSVWFEVSTFSAYGKLSGQRPGQDPAASAPEPSPAVIEPSPEGEPPPDDKNKRAPEDFALWKAAKEGEPSWESPWGPGRPGWHIECSAMAEAALGTSIDIHGGGLDLVFPHHENEIAQSECAHRGAPYARYWMHNGLLCMDSGQKMGKSLGNAYNVQEALTLFPAEAIRLYYLQVHYRSPLPWSLEALPSALALLSRLYEAREVAQRISDASGDAAATAIDPLAKELGEDAIRIVDLTASFEKRFCAAMDDDFNTGKALGIALELARAVNRFSNHKKAKKRGGPIAKAALSAFSLIPPALGLLHMSSADFDAEVKAKRLPTMGLSEATVEASLKERRDAREAKDFETGDRIRAELEEKGIIIMDQPGTTAWRIRTTAESGDV